MVAMVKEQQMNFLFVKYHTELVNTVILTVANSNDKTTTNIGKDKLMTYITLKRKLHSVMESYHVY